MNEPNSIDERRKIYCPVCGHKWLAFKDHETGKEYPPHPEDVVCARYRPTAPPAWLTPVLKAKADDEAKARGELLGAATTEWAATNGHAANGRAKSDG